MSQRQLSKSFFSQAQSAYDEGFEEYGKLLQEKQNLDRTLEDMEDNYERAKIVLDKAYTINDELKRKQASLEKSIKKLEHENDELKKNQHDWNR